MSAVLLAASTTTAPAAATTMRPDRQYGFATTLVGLTRHQLAAQLRGMRASGVRWLRYDLDWSAIQPTRSGKLQWGSFDAVTKAARRAGFRVLMIVDFAPGWAAAAGCDPTQQICAPASAAAYARFAGLAAAHYRRLGVTDWEIWNEPNIAYRFGPAANPTLYTAMLKGAYRAIHRAEPRATVITAGAAPSATDGVDYTPLDWLTALYEAGAKGYFDAVGAHPYTYPLTPRESSPYDAWGQLALMHRLMAAHGDGAKRIWITEYGAPTNGPNVAGDHVSDSAQATMVRQSIAIWRKLSWSGPYFYYTYQDASADPSTDENFFGLLRANGSRKPAYAAFVKAIR